LFEFSFVGETKLNSPFSFSAIKIIPCDSIPFILRGARFTKMETFFPMMVNDNPRDDREDCIELTDHEIFHTFFPFYMGIDQTKYAWMDEGWATVGEWYITKKIDSSLTDSYGMERVKRTTGKDNDVPMIIPSTENKISYFINAYPKPGLVYKYLNDMLGDELFRKTIQYYMRTWNGKHPMPWDFFNCVNKASGQDLNWFWYSWFYDWGAIDLGIKSVKKNVITIEMKGSKAVPIYMKVTFADGSKKEFHETAMVWKNKKEFTFTVPDKKEISKIDLNQLYVPDGNELNDHWKR
jgi:aminopeptidase N